MQRPVTLCMRLTRLWVQLLRAWSLQFIFLLSSYQNRSSQFAVFVLTPCTLQSEIVDLCVTERKEGDDDHRCRLSCVSNLWVFPVHSAIFTLIAILGHSSYILEMSLTRFFFLFCRYSIGSYTLHKDVLVTDIRSPLSRSWKAVITRKLKKNEWDWF